MTASETRQPSSIPPAGIGVESMPTAVSTSFIPMRLVTSERPQP